MIEWIKPRPKNKDKRVVKKFALIPTECHQDVWIWFESYYLLQEYQDNSGPYYYYKSKTSWQTINKLSKKQFKAFEQNIALHLTDENVRLREFAEIIQRKISKTNKENL